jgi:hypothetical protein
LPDVLDRVQLRRARNKIGVMFFGMASFAVPCQPARSSSRAGWHLLRLGNYGDDSIPIAFFNVVMREECNSFILLHNDKKVPPYRRGAWRNCNAHPAIMRPSAC